MRQSSLFGSSEENCHLSACHRRFLVNLQAVCHNSLLMVFKLACASKKVYVEIRKKRGVSSRKPTVQKHSLNLSDQKSHAFIKSVRATGLFRNGVNRGVEKNMLV